MITGLSSKVLFNHIEDAKPEFPSCSKPKQRVARKVVWEKAASNCEGFVQDKIRRTIHMHYREHKPVKLANLIAIVSSELKDSGIDFAPSCAGMWRILKGMGFRHSIIKKNPVIYERPDITKWRHDYLRF